ncbi:DUF4115 domain-containing protein [Mitsuaria sp. TWR114]|nr:DUF4115 domain-containing protein [Mitsuaria sp. TWR114]
MQAGGPRGRPLPRAARRDLRPGAGALDVPRAEDRGGAGAGDAAQQRRRGLAGPRHAGPEPAVPRALGEPGADALGRAAEAPGGARRGCAAGRRGGRVRDPVELDRAGDGAVPLGARVLDHHRDPRPGQRHRHRAGGDRQPPDQHRSPGGERLRGRAAVHRQRADAAAADLQRRDADHRAVPGARDDAGCRHAAGRLHRRFSRHRGRPADPGAPAPGTSPLKVRASAESWVEVVDAKGQVLLSRLLRPGDLVDVHGVAPLRLRVGNVSGTELVFRGQPVDLAARARDNVARLELN